VVKVLYINKWVYLKQGPGPEGPRLGVWRSAVRSPSVVLCEALAEVDFDVFWASKITSFLSTTRYSRIILTANLHDSSFVLGMTVFGQVWLI